VAPAEGEEMSKRKKPKKLKPAFPVRFVTTPKRSR
jgi:hypothetical protein